MQVFDNFFDATELYTTKRKMQKIGVSGVATGDILLVDAHLVRFRAEKKDHAGKATFVTNLRIVSVSKIVAAPRAVVRQEHEGFEWSV